MTNQRSVFLEIARDVLRLSHGRPMTVREIWESAVRLKLVPDDLRGRTPAQTLKSKITVDIHLRGERSDFARVAPGRFVLRSQLARSPSNRPPALGIDELPIQQHKRPRLSETRSERPPVEGRDDEYVAVIPTALIDAHWNFQGATAWSTALFDSVFRSGQGTWVRRELAERIESSRQVITYVVVTCGDSVLGFNRGRYTRADALLKGARCVGFGGHTELRDRTLWSDDDFGVRDAAFRELVEELHIPEPIRSQITPQSLKPLGFIRDDSSANGRRHVAVVYELAVSSSEGFGRSERAVTRLSWQPMRDIGVEIFEFEYWSQLVLRQFYGATDKSSLGLRVIHPESLQQPHVLCVVGPVGSGKSEAVRELTKQHGYSAINTGQVLAGLLGLPPVPATPREVFQKAASRFIRGENGPARLADAIYSFASTQTGPLLIDGIRQRATLSELRARLGDLRVSVAYIHTPPDVAFEFFRRREMQDASIEQFTKLRESPVESEVESLIMEADVVLYNFDGSARYRRVINELVSISATSEVGTQPRS